jgi:histidinol-phosphate aminotransferase
MVELEKLVRTNIIALKPYSSARDDFSGEAGIFLDANENPFGDLNRYPDPHQQTLKDKLKDLKKLSIKQVFIGNGSDEVIDLLIRIFCNPSLDKVIIWLM